jgi:radical SAM superfamily enzyme YgiQ (UPF0313 family)
LVKSSFKDNDLAILLIPPVINPISTDQAVNFIPVGLLVLLSTLARSGLRAEIYKPEILIAKDQDLTLVARDILSRRPKSLGFSTWCDSFPVSLLLAEEIKKIDPAMPILFGGPQASILAKNIMEKYPAVDYILRGEADYTLPEFISRLLNGGKEEAKDIPGLVYRDPSTHRVISDSPGEIVKDLDNLPVPAYEKIFQKSKIRIDAGRGCPYPCTYCTTNQFFSRKYRVKSAGRIIEEMEYGNQQLGVTGFGISHDMFTLNKDFIADFSGKLTTWNNSRKVPFDWTCSARTDCVTEDMLTQMRKSGCKAIFFGIESGSERIQKEIRKNLDLDEAVRIIRHSAELGIVTIVSYMAGFPGETHQDLNDTLRSILKVAIAGARPQLTLLSILPGTPIYQQHVDELDYDQVHSGFSVSHLTEKMNKLIMSDKKTFSSFYYLPNAEISRQTYLFLADLANYIEHFLSTLVLIRDHIQLAELNKDLLGYIENNIPEYQYGEDMVLPELYFLTDIVKKYLEYLQNNGMPAYVWDVFQADFTKAFMISMYERWQLTQAGKRKPHGGIIKPCAEDKIRPVPYWKLIETNHYLHDYVHDPVGMKGKAKFRSGHYHYLILPISHRMARIIKVPKAHVPTYRELKESTVAEFIRKNVVILGEDRTHEILRKMIRWRLVELEKNQ